MKHVWTLFLFMSVNAHAMLVTLKIDYPILGNSNIWVSTTYDPDNFTGYYTQGVQHTGIPGHHVRVHINRTSFVLADAMRYHDLCRYFMISVFITNQMSTSQWSPVPESPPTSSSSEEEPHSAGYVSAEDLEAIPEEMEEDGDACEFC